MTTPANNADSSARALGHLAAVAAVALIACLACTRMGEVDFWWQLKTGEIIAQGKIIRTEMFTLTRAGNPRIESSWLYCLLLYAAVTTIGIAGVGVIKVALATATLAIAAAASRPKGHWLIPAFVAALAALASSQRLVIRPELLSYFFLACFLCVIAIAQERRTRLVWLLPVIQVLWANTHSFMLLGPAVAALWFLCDRLCTLQRSAPERAHARPGRPNVLLAPGLLACCLVNPYGFATLRIGPDQLRVAIGDVNPVHFTFLASAAAVTCAILAFRVLRTRRRANPPAGSSLGAPDSSPSRSPHGQPQPRIAGLVVALLILVVAGTPALSQPVFGSLAALSPGASGGEKPVISELASPFVIDPRFTAVWYYKALIVIALVSICLNPCRQSLFWLTLMASMFVLSALAVRNLPLFAIAAIAPTARNLQESWLLHLAVPESFRRNSRRVCAVVVTSLALFQITQVVTNRFWLRQTSNIQFGIGVATLEFPHAAADFLASNRANGAMFNGHGVGSYLLARGFTVYIDSRAVDGLIDEYVRLHRDPLEFRAFVARHRIETLVLELHQSPLIAEAMRWTDWRPVFADHICVIFARDDVLRGVPRVNVLAPAWIESMLTTLPEPRPFVQLSLFRRFTNPVPYIRAAHLAQLLGAWPTAAELRDRAARAYPPLFHAASQ